MNHVALGVDHLLLFSEQTTGPLALIGVSQVRETACDGFSSITGQRRFAAAAARAACNWPACSCLKPLFVPQTPAPEVLSRSQTGADVDLACGFCT